MQGLGREVDFGPDNFNKPKILNPSESIAQIIYNLLLMKPGNLPSMPHVGIDIKQYLYMHEDALNGDELKDKIYSQCKELLPYLMIGDILVKVIPHQNNDILFINIPMSIGNEQSEKQLLMGFTKDSSGEMLTQYQLD